MPGYARQFIERLAGVSGRANHMPDWEQLLQQLAELHVISRVSSFYSCGECTFKLEPTALGSNKNPEIVVSTATYSLGVEVKAPSIFKHWESRSENPNQFASRFASKDIIMEMADGRTATLPRDNPVKDFLISANQKFAGFALNDPRFIGVLVICWDDFIYEPISSLIQPDCGLLTENSFFAGPDGRPYRFENVAGIVVIRHLYQLVLACRDEHLMDGISHPLDYGQMGKPPWKAFFQNPHGRLVPGEVIQCFDAREVCDEMGAEYRPQEFIMWL
ncbi:MAG: hypothetical protein V4723_03035 [Pseudomonadota bacterium]